MAAHTLTLLKQQLEQSNRWL